MSGTPTIYYSPTHGTHVMSCRSLISEANACPSCGEREVDRLVWEADEDVHCTTCGVIYDPSAPPVAS